MYIFLFFFFYSGNIVERYIIKTTVGLFTEVSSRPRIFRFRVIKAFGVSYIIRWKDRVSQEIIMDAIIISDFI